jgi:hypothetical protein
MGVGVDETAFLVKKVGKGVKRKRLEALWVYIILRGAIKGINSWGISYAASRKKVLTLDNLLLRH